jgi:hypothetical protein
VRPRPSGFARPRLTPDDRAEIERATPAKAEAVIQYDTRAHGFLCLVSGGGLTVVLRGYHRTSPIEAFRAAVAQPAVVIVGLIA